MKQNPPQPRLATALGLPILVAVLVGLYLLSRVDYLLFHSLIETFSAIVACGVFVIAWNSRRFRQNGFFLALGIAALFVAGTTLLHSLAFTSMGVLPGGGANLSSQFWIVSRFLGVSSLLLAPRYLSRPARPGRLFAAYGAATALLLAAVLTGFFPDCFREGSGLTPFKIGSEYLVCLLLSGAWGLIYRQRRTLDPGVLRNLSFAIASFILAGLSFNFYSDVFGITNMAGHLMQLSGYYFIYRGVVETGLTRPIDLLFRELKQSEERYRRLYLKTPVMLHSVDPRGCLVSVSDYWLAHLGYAREEVMGWPIAKFHTPESRRHTEETVLPVFFREGICRDVPCQLVKKNGEVIDVLLSAVAERDAAGAVERSLAVMVDVTTQRRDQERIVQLNDDLTERAAALEAANAELEAFNYTVSHDLRGPLTIINAQSQLVLGLFADDIGPRAREFIQGIYDQTLRMNQLITTLLNFSRLNRVELQRQAVDLSAMARSIAGELALREPQRQVDVAVASGLQVHADPNLLQILLENLLGNAWKYTREQQGVRIEVGSGEQEGEKVYFVRDNGPGFDPETAGELFSPFCRLSSAESSEGFGIGLATVRRIADRHAGRVWAESVPGAGATFFFSV